MFFNSYQFDGVLLHFGDLYLRVANANTDAKDGDCSTELDEINMLVEEEDIGELCVDDLHERD